MSATRYPVLSDTVPAGFCFQGFNTASWREILALMHVDVEGSDSITCSQTPPGPTLRDRPWLKLDSDNNPVRIYFYNAGLWLAYHPIPTGFCGLYLGTLASIVALDENADGAITPTATHGPFWERVTAANGKFLVGTGDITREVTGGTLTINPGDTGGQSEVSLTLAQMPGHKHAGNTGTLFIGPDSGYTQINIGGSNATTCYTDADLLWAGGDNDHVATGHENLPNYIGITVIRRTARKYYRGA